MDPNQGRGRQIYKYSGESDWEAYDRRRRAATPVPMKPEDQEMLKDFDWPGPSVSSPDDGSHLPVTRREESANAEAESATIPPEVLGNLRWNDSSVHLPPPGDSVERPVTRRQSTASNPRNRGRSVESRHQGTTRSRSLIPNLTPAVRYTSRPARYSLPVLQSGTNQARSNETRRGRSLTPRPLGEGALTPVLAAASTEPQQSRTGEVEPPKNPASSSSETNTSTDDGPAPTVTPGPYDPQVVPHTSGPQSDAASAASSHRPRQGGHSCPPASPIGEGEPPENTVSSPSRYSVTTDGRPQSSDPEVVPHTRGPQSDVTSATSSHRARQGGHSHSPAPHIGEVEPPENTVTSSSQNSAAADGPPPAITPRSSDSHVVPHTSEPQSDVASVTSSHRAPEGDRPSSALIKTESRVLSVLPEQPVPQVAQENVKRSKLFRVARTLFAKLKHLVKRNNAPAAVETSDVAEVNTPVVKRGLFTKLKKIVKSGTPASQDVHQDQQFPPASEEAAILSQLPALDFNRGRKREPTRLQYSYDY